MELIDTHVHVWDPARGYPWLSGALRRPYSLTDLRAGIRERSETVSTILVEAARGDDAETADLLAVAAADPGVAGVIGSAASRRPGAAHRLVKLVSGPYASNLVGLREHLDDGELPGAIRRLRHAFADHALALELNCDHRYLHQVGDIADIVGPGVPVVVDHVGGPPVDPGDRVAADAWHRTLTGLAAAGNVYLKLSGVLTQLPATAPGWRDSVLRHAVDVFGPSRVMLGSDWPVCLSAGSWSQAMDAVLSPAARRTPHEAAQMMAGTARAVFGLD